jgi:predicted dehydrogenase
MKRLSLAVIGLRFGGRHVRNIISEGFEVELAAVSDINPEFSATAVKLGVRPQAEDTGRAN